MRINRFLSQCGLGSRRSVEEFVRQGRVRVNGQIVESLSVRVDPASDVVELDGAVLKQAEPGRLYLYHKPRGVVCSFRRQGSAPCLADVLQESLLKGRLFHVGRLDRDSSGLLLLSDDGDLANALLHPSQPVWKRYHIELDAALSTNHLEAVREGELELDGRACAPARIRLLPEASARYEMELREGRNRQIRRMMQLLGRNILTLKRVAFGSLELGPLPEGELRSANEEERRALAEISGSSGSQPTSTEDET